MAERTILCAVADDGDARSVVATGTALARSMRLEPVFAHVVQVEVAAAAAAGGPGTGWAPVLEEPFARRRERAVEAGRALLASLDVPDSAASVRIGDPRAELQALAVARGAEAIVVGGSPPGTLLTAMRGSVGRWLAANGERPVVFAHPGPPRHEDRGPVLCGIEPRGAEAPGVALAAARFATLLARPLLIVHVGEFDPDAPDSAVDLTEELGVEGRTRLARRQMHDLADRLPDGVRCRIELDSGRPTKRLAARGRELRVPLTVVGSRGHGLLRSAITGSVSLELARSASHPVAVVPPEVAASVTPA